MLVEKSNKNFHISVNIKPTFTGQYTHWDSFGPKRRKTNLINTSFPNHNIELCLLHHQGLLWQCQACLLSNGTSARPNGVTTLL